MFVLKNGPIPYHLTYGSSNKIYSNYKINRKVSQLNKKIVINYQTNFTNLNIKRLLEEKEI